MISKWLRCIFVCKDFSFNIPIILKSIANTDQSDSYHATYNLNFSHLLHVGREAIILRIQFHAVSFTQHISLSNGYPRLQWNYRGLPPPLVLAERKFNI